MAKKGFIPNKLRPWIEARKRFKLSHAQIQMARELGMTPKSLSKLVPSKPQQWKSPLPIYLEELYKKRFGRTQPENVLSIEQAAEKKRLKRLEQKAAKRDAETSDPSKPIIYPDPPPSPEVERCPS